MIDHIAIQNFQSLRNVKLDLGQFTVIVGPSSSGKSALIRAFKVLASNVRGINVITRGAKMMSITARTATHTITLDRAERTGNYRLTPHDGEQKVFTKLNGGVPEQITQALRIEPVSDTGSVNFASQFDKPYLLAESGAAVARELGELTNVTQIYEAVRHANRIRAQAAQTLKTRRADLDLLKSRLADYTGLSERLELLADADAIDVKRRATAATAELLDRHIRQVEAATTILATTVIPQVPDRTAFDDLVNRYLDLQAKVQGLQVKKERLWVAGRLAQEKAHDVDHLQFQFKTSLIAAGVCPTCGQTTAETP